MLSAALVVNFMQECPEPQIELPGFYQAKRDYSARCCRIPGFASALKRNLFPAVDYSAISSKGDMAFVTELTKKSAAAIRRALSGGT